MRPAFDRRGVRRLLGVVTLFAGMAVSTAVALGLAMAMAPTAGADPMADCTTTTGVIVAVDFSPWGGDIERGCAGDPTTGFDALQKAGFTTAGDEHDGPAFVCRIDDDPPPSQDACIDTPPPSAYWAYWHADQGQTSWSYATQGAMSFEPSPGSVDAWTFGAGSPPSFPPSAVIATEIGPSTTLASTTSTSESTVGQAGGGVGSSTPTTGASGVHANAPGSAVSPTSPGSPDSTGPPGPSKAEEDLPATNSTGGSSTRSSVGSAGGHGPPGAAKSGAGTATLGGDPGSLPKIVDVLPGAHHGRSAGGSLAPFVVGTLAVIAVGGGAGWVAWRRQRTERAELT